MKVQCKALSTAVAAALAILCSATAGAGEVSLAGLGATSHHQQFIVHYKAGGDAGQVRAAWDASLSRAASTLRDARGNPPRMQFLRQLATGPMVVRSARPLDVAEAEQWMRSLANDPLVDHVEIDRILQPALDPDDPRLGEQWGFSNGNASLNVRPAWGMATGEGQVVAIIDTGRTRHPELDANTLPGYDFISNAGVAGDGNGRDANPDDPGDSQWGKPSSWHGTHVAGTVAALTNNGQGVAGTAFKARLVHARVLGKGGGYTSDIADAIVWSAGGRVNGVPDNAHPAKALNLSLGGSGSCDRAMQAAVDSAIRNGATVVVAAGNSNADVSRFTPANCRGVIAVAATTSRGARAGFSNFGTGITLAGPGEGILSTINTGRTSPGAPGYAVYSGTSMAAPHVAGVVALMQSAAGGTLAPDHVAAILKSTARPLPGACSGGCGAGIANAAGAVEKAMQAFVTAEQQPPSR